eukprot:CAMPEP_0197647410 /NCGR_PEP_ID=MMETSP1338-20131121/25254_1 /TAXON_ID=43686 ORGANISM="Pelagodinium beii, Strain RCC1491" /NCGR_SAMPLE_ID=MMETSP1338 /ASSEMBLY_ACC=CAM_ASM_000754 /LENGTH=86 /DNA_ID=CAMNT_0043221197 /DNA_START=64 /DNA_END=324 /DNA_ORIENTATION=+
MQQPGASVQELVAKQSVGSTFARIVARSKGVPVPFTAGIVNNSPTGQGWTMFSDYKFQAKGGVCSVLYPVAGGFAACIIIGKMLAK